MSSGSTPLPPYDTSTFATKDDLALLKAQLETKLFQWIAGVGTIQTLVTIGAVYAMVHAH